MSDEKEIRALFNNWIESTLVCSPKNGDPATKMAGHSLLILEKRDGRWQITRDANTLAAVPE